MAEPDETQLPWGARPISARRILPFLIAYLGGVVAGSLAAEWAGAAQGLPLLVLGMVPLIVFKVLFEVRAWQRARQHMPEQMFALGVGLTLTLAAVQLWLASWGWFESSGGGDAFVPGLYFLASAVGPYLVGWLMTGWSSRQEGER